MAGFYTQAKLTNTTPLIDVKDKDRTKAVEDFQKMPPLAADFRSGLNAGNEIFYKDPELNAIKDRLAGFSQGYDSQELGALKETARRDIAGQRSNYLRALSGNLAKGGVGGARAAAMKSAADAKFMDSAVDGERKMLLDSANMKRQGTSDYKDMIYQQKFGALGTGLGYAQLGSNERSSASALEAARRKSDPSAVDNLIDLATLGYGKNWRV